MITERQLTADTTIYVTIHLVLAGFVSREQQELKCLRLAPLVIVVVLTNPAG